MPTITIREEQRTELGFTATLSFDDRVEFEVAICDPFTMADEQRLEWYFEEWLRFPMLDTVKATQTVDSIKTYGEQLFQQIFLANPKAYVEYDKLRRNLSQLRIEIKSRNPEFHALHWEALRDPELPRPLAVDCVMIRKSTTPTAGKSEVEQSPTINLLMVTARPYKNDVAYRTISRPLIEALENSRLRVNVDLLRPATVDSLSRHLEEKGEGYYHIIHFDAHGALLTYQQFDRPIPSASNPLTYKRFGRDPLPAYEGVKAFLVMEGAEEDVEDLVEATELANLLTGKRIPVCILNACQSGKQLGSAAGQGEDYRETSLGSRLMAAGMQMVVAMGYSVTVTAAKVTISQLYQQLFGGKTIDQAIRLGRRELFNDKERQANFGMTISLEDWLLPVVYCNQLVNLNLRELSPQEEEAYFAALGQHFEFVQPEYEFVGRDLDILRIEKALVRQNMLLLQGMGGTGKTTLLNFLREWWEKTHFADKIFYFGYDNRAWTLEQILFDLGSQVYDRFEIGRFQAMSQVAQMEKMAALLRGANHILILDNLESVTGQELAIQNTLPQPEQDKLRKFLAKLAGGKTRVVFGSRSGEEWLKDATFKRNVYGLRGLDPEARTQLAERILERHVPRKAAALRLDEDFGRLMKVLAGYPLAMEVVLPNLKTQSPSEILVALQAADIDLDVESEDKTKSILKCVEYSHSNLSESAQKLLLCLAPFSGFINRDGIPNYAEELQKLEPFQDFNFANLDGAIQEAIHWGLLEAMDESDRLLSIQPVFPYFLKNKLASLDESICMALQEGFKNYYKGLANDYYNLIESKYPQEQQPAIFLCCLEYENLYNGLQICLKNEESVYIYFFCLFTYLTKKRDNPNCLKLSKFVSETLESYLFGRNKSDTLLIECTIILERLGVSYLNIRDYQNAKTTFQRIVDLCLVTTNYFAKLNTDIQLRIAYHQLGNIAFSLREYDEARQYYQRSLSIYIELGDRYEQSGTYHQLGRVAQELREYDEARQNYQQALAICIELGDRHKQAINYHCLGSIAEDLEDFPEAKNYFLQALHIWAECNDEYSLKTFSKPSLYRFYQTTQDASLLESIAQVLGINIDQARQQLESS